MPYFIIFILVAVIGIYAWTKLRQELTKLDEQDKAAAKQARQKLQDDKKKKRAARAETLKRDPKTGVYRIDDD